jgi:hypothetical protein
VTIAGIPERAGAGVVGRGEGTTLFRIDELNTVVGCANKFDFVTSTGEKINLAADLCVLDWEVVVKVAAAAVARREAPPAPARPPVAELPPRRPLAAPPPSGRDATAAQHPEVPGTPPVVPARPSGRSSRSRSTSPASRSRP